MTQTVLRPQALDSTTRLASKIIVATRDMTAASGDVAYTGVGFTPTAMIINSSISSGYAISIGLVDSSKTYRAMYTLASAGSMSEGAQALVIATSSTAYQLGIIKSFDSDGFTITWTKSNSPTGTGSLTFLCFR